MNKVKANVKRANALEVTINLIVYAASKVKTSWVAWREFSNTVNVLNKLSDAELFDIGLSRGDIRTVAYNAAYGRNT